MPNYEGETVLDNSAKTTGRISHPDNLERSIAHLRHRINALRSKVDDLILITQEGMSNKSNPEKVEKLDVPPTRPLATLLDQLPEDLRAESNAVDGIHEKIDVLKGMLL